MRENSVTLKYYEKLFPCVGIMQCSIHNFPVLQIILIPTFANSFFKAEFFDLSCSNSACNCTTWRKIIDRSFQNEFK